MEQLGRIIVTIPNFVFRDPGLHESHSVEIQEFDFDCLRKPSNEQ